MSSCLNVLIAVHIPDWWEQLAIERYRKHVDPQTRVIGRALTEDQQVAADRGGLAEALIRNARCAESDGARVHIIDCFGDPMVEQIASQVTRPVLGVGKAGLYFGHAFSKAFAVITSEQGVVREIRRNAERYGVQERLRACRAVGVGAAEIPTRREEVVGRLADVAGELPADVEMIVLGCTELAEMAPQLEAAARDAGRSVRVINPLIVTTHWAKALAAAM